MKRNEDITLELETVQTHVTYPWPESISQGEEMSLKYDADLFVLSPYRSTIQRTKIRFAFIVLVLMQLYLIINAQSAQSEDNLVHRAYRS